MPCAGQRSIRIVVLETVVFALDEEDIAVFVSEAGTISREGLIEACASCPVDALTAFDEKGEQLAP